MNCGIRGNEWRSERRIDDWSEEEGAPLHFIAQSRTSCADRYRSTKGDERPDCVCVCAPLVQGSSTRLVHSKDRGGKKELL